MNDIFNTIPVPHYRVRFRDFAIDSRDARLERVSLQKKKRTPPNNHNHNKRHLSSVSQPICAKREKKKNELKKPHIIFDRAIPEFSGDDLEYLPVEPATFGHGRIGIPIGRDLA